jgi:hypothetical protein
LRLILIPLGFRPGDVCIWSGQNCQFGHRMAGIIAPAGAH